MRGNKFLVVLAIAAATVFGLAGVAGATAIGIDVGDGVWDDQGEDNASGLQITATSFGKIGTGDGEKSVTVEGITFTHNVGDPVIVKAWADYSCIIDNDTGRYSGPIPWKFEGLSAGSPYNLAFLAGPSSQANKVIVDGVGTVTPDADGDSNFENVVASGLGVIEGEWDVWARNQWSTLTALLLEEAAAPVGDLLITKFQDDCDGVYEGTEPLLPGWSFTVDGQGPYSTDGSGSVLVPGLTPGLHTIDEILQPGWINCTPLPYEVNIEAGVLNEVFIGNMAIPEPCTFLVWGFGLIGLAAYATRRRTRKLGSQRK